MAGLFPSFLTDPSYCINKRSFILRVADPVRRILSFWRCPSCHPRGQGFIRHGSKLKASRPDFRRSSGQQHPIIIWTYTKPGTCSGYLPSPHKLGFLEKINKLWAKSLLLKSQQQWEPRFFPGPPSHHRATVPWNYGGIPTCSSFPSHVAQKQRPEVQVLEKQVSETLVLKRMEAEKPLPSWRVLSLTMERIRQPLETNFMNMQATSGNRSLGTEKHRMAIKPFLKPAHMQCQMIERNINDQVLEIRDPCHDDINRLSITSKLLPVPSRAPSRTAGGISPSHALSASTTPDPFTQLKDTRESSNSPDPLFSSKPVHSPPTPLMPRVGGNRSGSSPLNQRGHRAQVRCLNMQQLLPPSALKASAKAPQSPNSPDPLFSSKPVHSPPSPLMPLVGGNRSRSSPLNQRVHKAQVRCLNLQQLSPSLAREASAKVPKSPNSPDPLFSSEPVHSPPTPLMPLVGGNRSRTSPLNQRVHKAQVRCLNLQQLLPPLALKASAKAPQTPAQSTPASPPSEPVPDMISPVPDQARLQASRRRRTSRAKCTLFCPWTLCTATSDTLKSAAPAPANDTASALEPEDTSSSELIPASVPIGLGSKRICPISGRVILKARSRSARRHVSNSRTISTPTSDKSKSAGPASACTEAGASAPGRTSDQSSASALKSLASRSISPESDHEKPKAKRSLGASVTQDTLTITCASVPGSTSGQPSALTPSSLASGIACPAPGRVTRRARRRLGASVTQDTLTVTGASVSGSTSGQPSALTPSSLASGIACPAPVRVKRKAQRRHGASANPGKKLKSDSGAQQVVSL